MKRKRENDYIIFKRLINDYTGFLQDLLRFY